MKLGMVVWLVGITLGVAATRATTVAPMPTFEEMRRSAAFIGIVEVAQVPAEPVGGFHGDKPPTVQVRIVEAWKDAPKEWGGAYLWDDDFRPDKILSSNSWMPLKNLADIRVTLPTKGDRFVVFTEASGSGTLRDIYGWKRTPIVQNLPADHPDRKRGDWWGWSDDHCLRVGPLREVPRTRNFYGRQKFIYHSDPDDPRTQLCLRSADITTPGQYWVLTSHSATLMMVKTIERNPKWPLSYPHVSASCPIVPGRA